MNRFTGAFYIAVSAAAFGTLPIFGRFAYATGMDTFSMLFLRFTLAAILMGALLAIRRERLPSGRALAQLVGMGALGYAGQAFTYLSAIKYASAGLVALLLYLYPSIVALLSALFLKEKFTRIKVLALLMASLGAALTANPEGGQPLGVLLAFASAGIYSIYIVIGAGIMKQVSALQFSTIIFASSAIVYACLTAANGAHFPSTAAGWGVISGMALVATVIPVTTFLAGLKRVGPTNASMLSTLEPVVTVLLAALLLGEMLRPASLLGGALILAAVLLLARGELRSNPGT